MHQKRKDIPLIEAQCALRIVPQLFFSGPQVIILEYDHLYSQTFQLS